MDKLQVYSNGLFEAVRATMIEDEPWFVGSDVARSLDYNNPAEALRDHVDPEDIISTDTGRGILLINESGVYSLIFGSEQERAKQFKRWITKEVLPALRKTGQYRVGGQTTALDEKTALAIAQMFSAASARNLPYMVSALESAGIHIEPQDIHEARRRKKMQALSSAGISDADKTALRSEYSRARRKAFGVYDEDEELIFMLWQFRYDRMGTGQLSRRTGICIATIYSIMNRNQNTNPAYAKILKETILQMYAEQGIPFEITYTDTNASTNININKEEPENDRT